MAQRIIQIPTLNDSTSDFQNLFAIWNQVNDYFEDVRFDFARCSFLRPNAVAFLGGVARLIESRMGTAAFDWDSVRNGAVMMNLRQNGFAGMFGQSSSGWMGHSIPYREDGRPDVSGIMDYLTNDWLGRGWVQVSQRLSNAIAGRVWEIYSNAFEHADSSIGVFSCGQHFKNRNELLLSVVDFGQGIAANVRNFVSSDPRAGQIPAARCLRWAFQRGNTTRPNGMARGLGLDLLKEFVRVNHGRLEVYSNEGYACVGEGGEHYQNLPFAFEGTVFHIMFTCDERRYQLVSEAETHSPF